MKFSREQIYELVWSKSLSSIAKEYSISDNGLRKICKEYEIPIPKMGHWQKVQFGKDVTNDKLPVSDKWKDAQIELSDRGTISGEDHYLSRLSVLAKEIETELPKYLKVPEKLTDPDQLIIAVKSDLEPKKSTGWHGLKSSVSSSNNFLSVSVAKENVPRALRIMDTFIKLILARGHQLKVNERDTILFIHNENYVIRFREKQTRQPYKSGNWEHSDLVPNGILSIKLDNLFGKEWKDGKIPLEKQLARILAAFEIQAENDKVERTKREAWLAEYNRLEAIRKAEIETQQRELKRIELLKQHATQYRQAQEIEELIIAIELNSAKGDIQSKEWVLWAKRKLIELNPIPENLNDFVSGYNFDV